MATDDTISKWKNNKDTDTVFFGSRNDVIQKIRDRVGRQRGEFTDNEWSIKERPKKALFKQNDAPITDFEFKHKIETSARRIPNQNRRFYASERGLTNAGEVMQGEIGDCWYVAVLAGAAQVKGLINSIAVEYNENLGIYGFIFFKKSYWISIVVDDYLFYKDNGSVTWVPLLEKAYAKFHYSYESIHGNFPCLALASLGGIEIKGDIKSWNSILSITDGRKIFTCTHNEAKPPVKEHVGADGLVEHHVYTVLDAVNFHNNHLVKIRNPWANTEWNGPWSNKSPEWKTWANNNRIDELNYTFGNDGTFFMEHHDTTSHFDMDGREYPLEPGTIKLNQLISSWWNAQYTIFYTDRMHRPDLSTLELTFSTDQHPISLVSSSSGRDGFGPYVIEQGQHDRSLKTITFIKRYVNCNDNSVWHYRGHYSHKMFFGNWGTPNEPDIGKFIIKRVDKIEKKSLTGKWRGYYFYNPNNGNDQMLIDLTVHGNPAGGNTISGSGTDSVGRFTIQGQMLVNGSVNFIKQYVAGQSWNYNGLMKGSEMWGTWGNGGGVFFMWKC